MGSESSTLTNLIVILPFRDFCNQTLKLTAQKLCLEQKEIPRNEAHSQQTLPTGTELVCGAGKGCQDTAPGGDSDSKFPQADGTTETQSQQCPREVQV